MLDKLVQTFERLVMALIILALLPCLVSAIVRAIGTFDLLLILSILAVVAYLRQGAGAPAAGRRRTVSGAERTPLAPKGDE